MTVKVALPSGVNNTLANGGSVKAIARTVAHDDAGQQKTKARELTLKR